MYKYNKANKRSTPSKLNKTEIGNNEVEEAAQNLQLMTNGGGLGKGLDQDFQEMNYNTPGGNRNHEVFSGNMADQEHNSPEEELKEGDDIRQDAYASNRKNGGGGDGAGAAPSGLDGTLGGMTGGFPLMKTLGGENNKTEGPLIDEKSHGLTNPMNFKDVLDNIKH